MCDESEVGYAELAERLGKVRRVYTGPDGGIEAPVMVGVTVVNGGDAEDYLRSAAWQRPAERHPWTGEDEFAYPPELMTSGACIAELQRRVAAVETLAADLAMHVSALQTDLLGVQTANAYLEHRLSEMQRAASAQGGEL